MPASETKVRAYRPGDRDQVVALAPRLTEWVAPWRDPAAVLHAVQGWVTGSVDAAGQPDHAVYVAEQGGRVVGMVTVTEQAHFTGQVDAYVGELAVAPGLERQGVATGLMRAAEEWAARRGRAFLTLETGAANRPARGLYAALGYREEDVRLTKKLARLAVVPYDPEWPQRAAAVLAEVAGSLGPPVVHADHIGSTAVPGMAAKNILDLQLSVRDLDQAGAEFDRPLAALGFARRPYERDHVPAGADSDPARWAKRLWARRGHPAGDANLHVRLDGSPNERFALLFRDWLRAYPLAVAAYSEFKLALAEQVADIDPYTEVKDPVVDLIAAAAEPWAAATGWRPHASD